jgi:hypothetical protein
MKQLFSLAYRLHRPVDHAPTVVTAIGLTVAIIVRSWWPAFIIVPVSALEAAFVVAYQRRSPRLFPLSFAAWTVKNVCWSAGMVRGLVDCVIDDEVRTMVRSKRIIAPACVETL